jgi:hypothetical protein
MSEFKNHEDPFNAAVERAIAKETEETVETTDEVVEEEIKIVPETTEEVIAPEVDEVEPVKADEESEPTSEDDTTLVDESTKVDDKEVSNFDDWDATPEVEEVVTDAPVEPNYEDFAKDLGFEAKTREEIIAKVKAIEAATAQKVEETAGLPDNLKKAIEIAQLDGDYLQYLGVTSVDYSQVDNTVLVQDQLARLPSMQLANGEGVDIEKLAEALEGMTDLDIEMRGSEIKTTLTAQQDTFKANVEREAQAARLEADTNLKAALDKMQEVRGFKINGTHKKKLYDSISSGQMVQDLFYGADGKMDYNKVAKIVFDATYGDKVNSFLKQRITTSTKKELLKKLSNTQIEPKAGDLPNATSKPKNAQQQFADSLAGRS